MYRATLRHSPFFRYNRHQFRVFARTGRLSNPERKLVRNCANVQSDSRIQPAGTSLQDYSGLPESLSCVLFCWFRLLAEFCRIPQVLFQRRRRIQSARRLPICKLNPLRYRRQQAQPLHPPSRRRRQPNRPFGQPSGRRYSRQTNQLTRFPRLPGQLYSQP